MENKNDNIPDIEFIEYDLVEETEYETSHKDEIIKEEDNSSEENVEATEEEEKEINIKKEILSWALMLVVAVGIAAFISNFILINAFIPTGSMENTIPKKSRLIGLRLAYTFSEPERGDVIIFKNPNKPEENYVKRIIGLPGETVVLENSTVFIYDEDGNLKHGPLNEPYLKNKHWMAQDEKYEFHVPKDRYLVLGDNRNNSADARTWYNVKGDVEDVYIHKDKIIAKALLIYWDSFHVFKDVDYK